MANPLLRVRGLLAILLAAWCGLGAGSVLAQAEFSPSLRARLAVTAPDERLRVHVILSHQADAAKIRLQASAKGLTRDQRAHRVAAYLKSQHREAQAPLVEALAGTAGVGRVEPRWIVNLVGFDATPAAIAAIAARPDVEAINLELPWVFEDAVETIVTVASPNGVELGLRAIKAPAMWKRGYTGFGGVALTADTGVDPYHPALNHKYTGHDGRVAPWFINGVSELPADCEDHGTHVTGTMLGLDRVTNDTIGVAPDAHWMGGAVLCGFGASDNLKLFEWALQPDEDSEVGEGRPIVINNSWYDPSIRDFECTDRNPYPRVLDNLQLAGIAVVWSAGNDGPKPSTITPPHSYNSNITNAFTVGALNGNRGSFPIADFSSRGPATCAGGTVELDIKPEVSAPGVDVRSALPGGGYGLKSGTSMASPHTAGAVLLLHEAFPDLDGDKLLEALYFSARDLGEPGEDNTYGRGIIDVDAAYEYLLGLGVTPTPAQRPDLMANVVASTGKVKQCAGPLELSVTIANPGSVEIATIKYELAGVSEDPIVLRTEMVVAAGEATTLSLNPLFTVEGRRVASFRILEINGMPADPRLDLGASWELELSRNAAPELIVDRPDSTLCLGSPVELSLRSALTDPAVLFFSENPNLQVVPADAGSRFFVASLTEPLVLYGVNEYRKTGGPAYPTSDAALVFADPIATQLRFVGLGRGIVRSVTVNQLTAGRLMMELKRVDNMEVVGRYNRLTQAGINDLETFFQIETGVEYVLEITGGPKLAYQSNTSVSSIPVSGMIDFRSVVSESAALRASSYFFFDWRVGYGDGCALAEVTLVPDSSRAAGQRDLTVDKSSAIVGESIRARDAKFPYGTDYRWTLGDSTLDVSGEVVEIVLREAGELALRMTTVDDNRCATADETTITVTERSSGATEAPGNAKLVLWPNPSTGSFSLAGETEGVTAIEIFDVAGRRVKRFPNVRSRYPVEDLSNGVYTVRVWRSGSTAESLALEILR